MIGALCFLIFGNELEILTLCEVFMSSMVINLTYVSEITSVSLSNLSIERNNNSFSKRDVTLSNAPSKSRLKGCLRTGFSFHLSQARA
jgi:hypothetical protein